MKPIQKIAASILLIIALSFASCNKGPGLPLPPLPPIRDSLSGREFLFNNLIWKDEGWAVYIEIPNSKLFLNRGIEVSIDSSIRIDVPFYTFEYPPGTFPFPVNNGYVYDNNHFVSLFVLL